MKKYDGQLILRQIQKALEMQFETYTWEKMIDDCDLNNEDRKWAKKNIGYKAYIFDERFLT